MKIENPFESGHIKNYILAYVGVVVIMVLFFLAATLWNDPKEYPKKEFPAEPAVGKKKVHKVSKKEKNEKDTNGIKLMEGVY